MAKARIVTADGTEVNLEGTPTEIVALLKELKIKVEPPAPSAKSSSKVAGTKSVSKRPTVGGLLDELTDEQFFKKPKTISEVKRQLANLGHHYPVTSLSGPLMGHVRKRKLRRFKDAGKYVYSQ